MKSGKKWLAGILSIVMTMAFMPMYAFAGEASSDSADTDAVWTVKDVGGNIEGSFNELQDAMNLSRNYYESTIVLNRNASGKGAALALSDKDSSYYNFDFNGNTYTVIEGVTFGEESKRAGVFLQGNDVFCTFENGTLKIQNCEIGISTDDANMTNFNIDASASNVCENVLNIDSITINGDSSVKAPAGNNAIQTIYTTIDTTGTVQGDIICKKENGRLKIYSGLFTERPKTIYIANGYTVKAENGTFSVIPTEEWAPTLEKIKELQNEVDETNTAVGSDQKEMVNKIRQLEKSIGIAEKALNDDIYEENIEIDKAVFDAETSIQEAKIQLKNLQILMEQKGTEYSAKGKELEAKCNELIEELNKSECDSGNYNISCLRDMAEDIQSSFNSNQYYEDDEGECMIEFKLEELSQNLTKVEVKLGKAKELLKKENENLEDTLDATKKELDEAKDSLNKTNKELEDLNKKVDALQNSLKETQDKLMKAEAQLKNSPVKKPGQVKGLKLKAGKKKVTVTYKKASGATSYKVTYSTSKKFKKAKTVTVKSGKTVKKTISKLKSKKTYYVKLCAVKKVKGKNYIGKWSAVKKVKVK